MDQDAFERAIRSYWTVRDSQAAKQLTAGKVDAGTRGAATGGAHLDALAQLLEDVFVSAGFPRSAVRRSTGRERLYDAACFVTSPKDPEQPIHQPDPEVNFSNFIAAIAGRAAYVKAL